MGFWSKKVPAFNASKMKANLRMAITRLRMHQNKLANGTKVQRRQVAELLALQKYESARVRVEQVLRDDVSIEGYEVLALFLDLLSNRVHLIAELGNEGEVSSANSKGKGYALCPPELKECVTSILWAAAQLGSVVPELQTVSKCLELKFGSDFVAMSVSNAEFSVNLKIMERLGITTPSSSRCIEYLTHVAAEYGVEGYDEQKLWDPEGLIPLAPGLSATGRSVDLDVKTNLLVTASDFATDRLADVTVTPAGSLIPALTEARDALEQRLLQLKRG